jgi:hypothetical protein
MRGALECSFAGDFVLYNLQKVGQKGKAKLPAIN